MKNQYIGDIGDYGKYGLLRFLRDSGVKIGVNWYLTPNDGRTDGCHTEYLGIEAMRQYDEDLFDAMKPIAPMDDKHICMVESSGVLDGIAFYHEEMDFDSSPSRIRGEKRAEWHRRALTALSGCELVFADPDNGLIDRKPSAKGAQKYILPEEIECYFKRGQQVVYYQHKPRINETNWGAFKRRILMKIPEARLLAVSFNRWSCRTYIFVLHESEYARYEKLIGSFLESDWGQLKVGGKPAFIPEII